MKTSLEAFLIVIIVMSSIGGLLTTSKLTNYHYSDLDAGIGYDVVSLLCSIGLLVWATILLHLS
jgi:uncharacterized membrane protein